MDSNNFILGLIAGIVAGAVSQLSLSVYEALRRGNGKNSSDNEIDDLDEDEAPIIDCPECGLPAEAALVFVVDDNELVSSYVMIYCLGKHEPLPVTTEWFEQYVNGQQ